MKILKVLFLSILFIGMNSCSSSDEDNGPSVTSITITADATTKMVGETITFTVTDNNGTDVTSTSTISVAAAPIAGNTFSSVAAGAFQVVATLDGLTSEALTVNFTEEPLPPAISFEKRVLLEDYTGTWCGYCPRVSYGIELVEAATEKAVVVAIHRQDEYNFNAGALESMINLQGYPTAMLNRKTEWTYPEPNNVNQVVNLTTGENPKLGLAMTSTVSGGNINLEVKTKFGQDFTGAKLVVYVVENGLISDQENYTSYYNGDDVIADFEHNHVLRASLTNLLGDAFTAEESVHANEVTKTFNVAVPASVANAANIQFVAFVVGADKKAINVRLSNPGETQALEIVE